MLLKTLVPLGIVIAFHRQRGWGWTRAGLAWPESPVPILMLGAAVGSLQWLLESVTVRPLGQLLFNQPKNLEVFEPIRDDLGMLLLYLAFMWMLAAVAEEVIWRGFVMRELAAILGQGRRGWLLALALSSVLFGILHYYQGPEGMLQTTFGGLVLGGLFLAGGGRSLWLPILVHGFYNTVSFVLIYLGRYPGL